MGTVAASLDKIEKNIQNKPGKKSTLAKIEALRMSLRSQSGGGEAESATETHLEIIKSGQQGNQPLNENQTNRSESPDEPRPQGNDPAEMLQDQEPKSQNAKTDQRVDLWKTESSRNAGNKPKKALDDRPPEYLAERARVALQKPNSNFQPTPQGRKPGGLTVVEREKIDQARRKERFIADLLARAQVLPEPGKTILEMFYRDGKTHDEIGNKLGFKKGSNEDYVAKIKSRALRSIGVSRRGSRRLDFGQRKPPVKRKPGADERS